MSEPIRPTKNTTAAPYASVTAVYQRNCHGV